LATPTLVPAIEKGDFDLAEQEVKTYCEKLKNLPVLILGCTHYPIIKDLFQKHLPNTRIIAQTELMGKKLGDYLIRHTEIESKLSQNQSRQFFITKKTEGYLNVARLIDSDINLKLF
jgi:glutamate racemase